MEEIYVRTYLPTLTLVSELAAGPMTSHTKHPTCMLGVQGSLSLRPRLHILSFSSADKPSTVKALSS